MSGSAGLDIGRRLTKLRAMSPREVVHRLQYRLAVKNERRLLRRHALASPDRLRDAVRGDLREGDWRERVLAARRTSDARFLPGAHEPERMRHAFQHAYRCELLETLKNATNAREHRFEFFGREFQYDGDIAWQSDPVSGRRWPNVFHADVPIHRGDIGYGDVKYVWELNRQQFLMDLSKAYFLTGELQYAAAVRALVSSWIAGNPYGTGVNWACALEPAFRTFSWLWAYHLTLDALDDDFHLEWLQGLFDHARFLDAHLEHYSSPFNHLIGEAAALYMLGLCFPEFRDAPRWRQRGRDVLVGRLGDQFYADGGSVEQSTFYHHATIGFYLLAALTGRANGDELPPDVWSAIERGMDFSAALVQPDGTTPAIGGADDGKPIRMEHLPLWDFRAYQAIGAVLFRRGDLKAIAGRFHEDALWLLGPDGAVAFDALESHPPQQTSRVLDASGYCVLRSDWSTRADYVCFDCGEQAAGLRTDGVPNSMHGHADCLSLIAWLGGQRVLVDSGLFAYNCGGEWEAHFRETAAHNTARIDGRDQARHLGKMAWSHSYRASLEHATTETGHTWVVGSHDGYARRPDGVIHRRAVWLRPDNYLVIFDEFVGSGEHDLEVNYQFAPGVLVSTHAAADSEMAAGPSAVFTARDGDSVDIAYASAVPWTARLSRGGPSPADGWIAPSLGVREAAPRLSLTCRTTDSRTTLVTVLASRTTSQQRITRLSPSPPTLSSHGRMSPEALLLAVAGRDCTDLVAASGLSAGGAIATDALLAVCRVRANLAVESDRIGGTYLQIDREALARLESPAKSPPTTP